MQDEKTWMDQQDAEESMAKERYEFFTRPEPRENMSDIYFEDDEYLGVAKCRDVRIGMLRNAAEDNKKTVKAYLEPFPHIRIDSAKPLQGWYKSLHEPPNVRPRPCFTEAILTEPYGGYCMPAGALLDTPNGPVKIKDIKPGDMVVGQDTDGNLALTEVLATVNRWCKEGLLKINFNDGESLLLTAEHPVYSLDRQDYVKAGDLNHGEKIEARPVQELRRACERSRQEALVGGPNQNWESGHHAEQRVSTESIVSSIEILPTPLRVYDIQTISENFYARGEIGSQAFHVHNCAVGCQFSLPAGELINTPEGMKAIESFIVGDIVYGRTINGCFPIKVTGTSAHLKPEGYVVLELNDGRVLKLTGDHPIYSAKRGWVATETLQEGELLEDISLSRLQRRASAGEEVVSPLLVNTQSKTEKAIKAVQRLLSHNSSEPLSLRCLQFVDQVGQRQTYGRQGAARAKGTKVRANSQEDERVCIGPPRRNGRKSKRTQNSGVEVSSSGTGATGNIRVQVVKEATVCRLQGTQVPDAINLGGSGCTVFRRSGIQLGLRAGSDCSTGWNRLYSRLQDSARWILHRGKRILFGQGQEEGRTSQESWVSDSTLRSKNHGAVRDPIVKKVTRVQGPVQVYDIETETGNFYHSGILDHNCYINSGMRGYRGSGLISVPLNYGEQIAKQLSKMRRGAAGYFSSFTDPFTPLEFHYHNTQRAAEEFVKVGLPIFFLSRLPYPDWAIDLLTENPHSYAQKSINTSDPEDWRKLSPGALPLEKHIEEIAKIHDRGIYVSIQVNPIVPGVTSDGDIVRLFKMLADAGADHVIVKFVEAAYSWAPAMVERMVKRFGERGKEFERLFTQNIGSERTVEEAYRIKSHKLYAKVAARHGMTYATCYEYRYERDAQGKVLNKTGVSIGREFTTADQCHGHRVPVYGRSTEEELFKALEECPPSGCLYCASENEGKPRCGDELAGDASALRAADLKIPIGQGKRKLMELPIVS